MCSYSICSYYSNAKNAFYYTLLDRLAPDLYQPLRVHNTNHLWLFEPLKGDCGLGFSHYSRDRHDMAAQSSTWAYDILQYSFMYSDQFIMIVIIKIHNNNLS